MYLAIKARFGVERLASWGRTGYFGKWAGRSCLTAKPRQRGAWANEVTARVVNRGL